MPQIEISSAAFDFLKTRAKPLEDTTVSVVDRLISEFETLLKGNPSTHSGVLINAIDAPSMKHTTVIDAKIDGVAASQNYWNNILEDTIRICVNKGADPSTVRKLLSANIKENSHSENGFRFIPEANFSFQGLEANRAFKNIVSLITSFHVPINITVKWPNRDDVTMPNATAQIIYP
ncbi:T4SS efffector SepA family protein [Hoeflea sp.]|uniref:T4SS efffector SepA family protein n=1 Tax=Hoeflea sp. TaxID=1940281 RepID=UPI003BB1D972